MAKKMSPEPIKESVLNQIIQAGIRVPDHGALNPWKLAIIQGKQRAIICLLYTSPSPRDRG